MYCYYHKVINETKHPILNNVDVVLILTMKASNRFKEEPFLLNLAKKTIIQYNEGYKKCKKTNTIISSKEDIVHAYYTAFEYLKEYNNVIILEDDAIVINKDLIVYEKIDNFIKNQNFNIFSFGSFGFFSKYNNDFYEIFFYANAQANVYSKDARKLLLNNIIETNLTNGDIDTTYINNLTNKYTYKYPLIVQLFPETENMSNWYNVYILLLLHKLIIKILKLNVEPNGWYILYFLFKNYILIILIVSVLFLIIYFLTKKMSIIYKKYNKK